MPLFAYRALTAGGQAARGVVDADTPRAAWQAIRTRGLYPTTIADAAAASAGVRLSGAELADATRTLASLLAAGLPLGEAIDAATESSAPRPARALALVSGRVREGGSLADALATLAGSYAAVCRAVVRAGEASGDVAGALASLAGHLETTIARRRRLVAALTYPAIVAATTLAVLLFLAAWVLPQIDSSLAGGAARLPVATRAALAAGRLVRATWWVWAGGGILAAFLLARTARRGLAPAAWARLAALPLVGATVREAAAARAAHALGTLLDAGLALDAAMPHAIEAAGAPLAAALAAADAHVRAGGTLAQGLVRGGSFPPLLVRLVATGERAGTLGAALRRAAELLDAGVARRIDRATALVEPTLVLVAGGIVLGIVLAILLPIIGYDPAGLR